MNKNSVNITKKLKPKPTETKINELSLRNTGQMQRLQIQC